MRFSGEQLPSVPCMVHMSKTTAGVILPWMMAEVARASDIGHRYVEAVIIPRRQALANHISDAIESGELRKDLDVELAIDLITGPWVYRLLISGGEMPSTDPNTLLDLVMGGIASP